MAIRVALHHRTSYRYDRSVQIFPQVVRLRPAPHCRTPITSYSLKVLPGDHFINWQQDPYGNFLARLVFPEKADRFELTVDLVAELTVINPFDFFLEPAAEKFPFVYEEYLKEDLRPYLATKEVGPLLAEFLATIPRDPLRTVDFLVDVNQRVNKRVGYIVRKDPGVQTCEETLSLAQGSCRDSAWLLVQMFRNMGLAARFVSGYSIQLTADIKSLDGPSGVENDLTDLHAWTEVYLPGAGWVGLDPTSGLFTGEGHLPLAATPDPISAAPVTGGVDKCESTFDFDMTVTRIHEDPRVTKPYSEMQWAEIERLGTKVDEILKAGDVRLTMGGEPTFVSIDDMDGEEWNTAALGKNKRRLAGQLIKRLGTKFATGPLYHYGQGKWYPGEPLPRWALGCYWRNDGEPIWENPDLIADDDADFGHSDVDAKAFIDDLAERLGVGGDHVMPGYEDAWYYLWKERKLPSNVDPLESKLSDKIERDRLARIFDQGLNKTVGYSLPLARDHFPDGKSAWRSGPWFLRQEHMFLLPGDSAMGFRLPLDSLPWVAEADFPHVLAADPLAPRDALPCRADLGSASPLRRIGETDRNGRDDYGAGINGAAVNGAAANGAGFEGRGFDGDGPARLREVRHDLAALAHAELERALAGGGVHGGSAAGEAVVRMQHAAGLLEGDEATERATRIHNRLAGNLSAAAEPSWSTVPKPGSSAKSITRTALCVEPRQGKLHVFTPPLEFVEDYLDLVMKIEQTAARLGMPVVIEGYPPPHDYRLSHLKVTPDPGVIEVNLQPAASWAELTRNTTVLYDEARLTRLGTEKFMVDGRHTGTGGGNHIVLGGARPVDSPLLRRPDLLRSLVAYWHNHPSLSYLFSGLFVGPTSQAPRIDEARHESIYELETAFQQLQQTNQCPPWLTDRLFRHLLVDITGNTHRSEFCIDKLFSPDSASGRLGLVEMRAFEMPPHARMSLTQQLLLRSLIAKFWDTPYTTPLARWGTGLHDRFLLPHFVAEDFVDVIDDLRAGGFEFKQEWFDAHFEFRFPVCGRIVRRSIDVELRQAMEPWHVLGEETTGQGTSRFVDSSIERVQVKVRGMVDGRHFVACNGRRVPLHATGVVGEFVAGVRFRAWQPPSCLHPTIEVHAPLVFDIVDTWSSRSIGGCTWYVSHPGGRSYETFPVNAYEAESRRNARFFAMGHTGGKFEPPAAELNADYPFTLDLRRAPQYAPSA